ncbi:PKD domain-containing protein [Roseobacter sinensis]|uniref:PKD domain-containing protein n=1 Tax=Roseobacter sinensis TaxID=2931391 RepID=A0ABT3BKD9_9RHOB|nr:PKD domain-containing protein [Roseobacter sp. WL0113]MCV3273819.1 PKD domain-containing protein [Roseobacter sp. WL0113]
MSGRRGFISGLLSGTAVTIILGSSTAAVAQYQAPFPIQGLVGLSQAQWSLIPEPSLTGDTAIVDITELPEYPLGYQPEAFRVRVNGGAPVTLPFAKRTNKPRHIRIPSSGTAAVEVAIVWRSEEDRATNVESVWSDAKTVEPMTTSTPSIIISSTRTTGTAPAGFMFVAEVNGFGVLNPSQDLHWKWTYDDPGSVHKRMRPEYVAVHGNDANVSYDHVGAHTFERPGTYRVRLTCTDRDGNSVTSDPYLITVEDPDVVFAGANTIVIAPSGMQNIGPSGARYFVSPADARSAWTQSTGRYRLLLERGYSYELYQQLNRPAELQIGPCGFGRDPLITERMPLTYGNGDEAGYSVWGLQFDDGYDPSNPEAGSGTQGVYNAIDIGVQDLTIHDCGFSGFNVPIQPSDNKRWIMSSTEVTNWSNFGMFQSVSIEHAIVGCTIVQNPLAIRKGDGKSYAHPIYADHGPYRTNYNRGDCAVIQSDLFSSVNWAGDTVIQICMRVNAVGDEGYAMNISQCKTEGGALYIGPTAGDDGSPWMDIKVSKHHHVTACSAMTAIAIGNALMENCIVVCGADPFEGLAFSQYVNVRDTFNGFSTGVENTSRPFIRKRPDKGLGSEFTVRWRNMTIIDLRAAADIPSDFQPTRAADFQLIANDNLIHAPNGQGPVANLDLSQAFTPRYVGRLVYGENGNALQTEYSNAGNGLMGVPLADCPAIGAATGETALDDFTGQLRRDTVAGLARTTYSQGAWEPALER